jgi:hypothetical protein
MSNSHEEDANITQQADVVVGTCDLPVTGVTPSAWGPSWLRELAAPASIAALNSTCLTPHPHVGWMLPNRTVICATCQPRLPDAVQVNLVDTVDGLEWQVLPAEAAASVVPEKVIAQSIAADEPPSGASHPPAVATQGPLSFI